MHFTAGGSISNLLRHLRLRHKDISLENNDSIEHIEVLESTAEETYEYLESKRKKIESERHLSSFCKPQPMEITDPKVIIARFLPPSKVKMKPPQDNVPYHKVVSISHAKQLNEQLTRAIIKEYYPVKMVEHIEFKKFINMLCPEYKMPNRQTLVNSLIPRFYNETKVTVKAELDTASSVCLTFDTWRSKSQISHIAITAHFVSKSCSLQSLLISCITYEDRHSTNDIASMLMKEAKEWDLNDKVACVVSDNASNIVSAVEINGWKHFPCFAHTLGLVVNDGLSLFDFILVKVRPIVRYFKSSSKTKVKFCSVQKKLNLPETKLRQDSEKCWVSTYDMIENVVMSQAAICEILTNDKPELNTLSPEDWDILERILAIFKIFQEVANEMRDEKYIPLSKIMIMINAINKYLKKHANEANNKTKRLVIVLIKSMESRFEDIERMELVNESVLLDPRFKKYGFTTPLKYESCCDCLRAKLEGLVKRRTKEVIKIEETSGLWSDFENQVEDSQILMDSKEELEKYLDEPLIDRKSDHLKWWQARSKMFWRLHMLMQERLCIVSTRVACDKIFSKAHLATEYRRGYLNASKVTQTVFLNHNF